MMVTLRKEMLHLCHACGHEHPAMMMPDSFEMLHDGFESCSVADVFDLQGLTTLPSESDLAEVKKLMKWY